MKKLYHILVFLCICCCNKSYVNFQTTWTGSILCGKQTDLLYSSHAEKFGLFSSMLWNDYFSSLHSEIEYFGVFPRYVHWYIEMDNDYPQDILHYNAALGIKTIINQDLRSSRFSTRRNNNILTEIVDGKWDRHFRSFARKARKSRDTIYYRFGYEMNGNWFPWCEQPQKFIEAWRRVWWIFYKEEAYNVKWIFSPSVLWDNSPYLHQIHPYYPGDAYVDIVALDGYNFGDDHSRHHRWQSFNEIFGQSLEMIHTYEKPIWIAEIGCPADPRRCAWLKEFFTFMDNSCCVNVFLWFNDYKEGEPDFRMQSDSASLQLFREWVQKSPNYHDRKLL